MTTSVNVRTEPASKRWSVDWAGGLFLGRKGGWAFPLVAAHLFAASGRWGGRG